MRLRRWRTADLALAVSLLLAGAAASDSTLFECPKGRYRILSYSIVFSRLTTFPPKHCFIFLDFLIKWICGDSNVIFQFLKKKCNPASRDFSIPHSSDCRRCEVCRWESETLETVGPPTAHRATSQCPAWATPRWLRRVGWSCCCGLVALGWSYNH